MTKHLLHLFILLSLMLVSLSVQARDPEIRLYKMTRDGHSEKYMLFGKADNPGCHNTPYTYHVYKVAVLAFKYCSVFSAKDCQKDSILTAYWKNKDKPATQMKQGTRWFMARDESEVDISSWSCEIKDAK
jgi:hypothetical protein